MSFNESNTVEQMILDTVAPSRSTEPFTLHEDPPGWGRSMGKDIAGAPPRNWTYVPATDLPRQPGEVMVEPWLRVALVRLNPEIKAQPDRADEVIYALRPEVRMTRWKQPESNPSSPDPLFRPSYHRRSSVAPPSFLRLSSVPPPTASRRWDGGGTEEQRREDGGISVLRRY